MPSGVCRVCASLYQCLGGEKEGVGREGAAEERAVLDSQCEAVSLFCVSLCD